MDMKYKLFAAILFQLAWAPMRLALADSVSTTLEIAGRVSVRCGLNLEATPGATNLNLNDGERNLVVGRVAELCNSPGGYSVLLSSQNSGELRSRAEGAAPIAYRIRYDQVSGSLAQGLSAERTANGAPTGAVDIAIDVPASGRAAPGVYSDIITISIKTK